MKREIRTARIFLRKQMRVIDSIIATIKTHPYNKAAKLERIKRLRKFKYEIQGVLNTSEIFPESSNSNNLIDQLKFEDINEGVYRKSIKRLYESIDPTLKIEKRTLKRIIDKYFYLPLYQS